MATDLPVTHPLAYTSYCSRCCEIHRILTILFQIYSQLRGAYFTPSRDHEGRVYVAYRLGVDLRCKCSFRGDVPGDSRGSQFPMVRSS